MMKGLQGMLVVAVLLAAAGAAQAHFWLYATDFASTGVIDEQTVQTNAIDREAVDNAKTLAQFKTDVATAFAADLGGVTNWGTAWGYRGDTGTKQFGLGEGGIGRGFNYFDSVGSVAGGGEKTKILYGATQSKAVLAVPTRALEIWPHGYPDVWTGVSGPSYYCQDTGGPIAASRGAVITPETNYYRTPDSDNTRETLTFTGLTAGQEISELGFVLISNGMSAQTVNVWVDYADLTSSPVRSIYQAQGNDDVFVYFAAGSSPIRALHWDSDYDRPGLGDLGFIVTPEPTSAAILLAGLAMMKRRRRGAEAWA